VLPSYLVNKEPNKKNEIEYFNYIQDYNKTSIMKIKSKIIKTFRKNPTMQYMGIQDMLNFSAIIYMLFQAQKYKRIAKITKPYDLNLKNVEAIVKIDKNIKEKSLIPGRDRNKVKQLLDS
jgi:hypothetical protein